MPTTQARLIRVIHASVTPAMLHYIARTAWRDKAGWLRNHVSVLPNLFVLKQIKPIARKTRPSTVWLTRY
jgi:hypothetical protein